MASVFFNRRRESLIPLLWIMHLDMFSQHEKYGAQNWREREKDFKNSVPLAICVSTIMLFWHHARYLFLLWMDEGFRGDMQQSTANINGTLFWRKRLRLSNFFWRHMRSFFKITFSSQNIKAFSIPLQSKHLFQDMEEYQFPVSL